jgi:hypothetical protein
MLGRPSTRPSSIVKPGTFTSAALRGSNTTAPGSSHTSNSPLHDGDAAEGGSSRQTSSGSFSGSGRQSTLEQAAAQSPTALSLIQQMPKGTTRVHAHISFCLLLLTCFPSPPIVSRTNPEEMVIQESWLRRQYVRTLVYCNTAMLMPDSTGSGERLLSLVQNKTNRKADPPFSVPQ